MSDRKRVRAWQEAQRRETALTTPRHFRESISLTGIGMRQLQLARVPSFERTEVWDLHRDPETQSLRLYTARSAGPDSDHVVGCEEVDVESAILEDILRRSGTPILRLLVQVSTRTASPTAPTSRFLSTASGRTAPSAGARARGLKPGFRSRLSFMRPWRSFATAHAGRSNTSQVRRLSGAGQVSSRRGPSR